jgi:hypothetical protein
MPSPLLLLELWLLLVAWQALASQALLVWAVQALLGLLLLPIWLLPMAQQALELALELLEALALPVLLALEQVLLDCSVASAL